jgi:hypothetical protein
VESNNEVWLSPWQGDEGDVFWPVVGVDGRVILRLLEIASQRESGDGDDAFSQRDRWRWGGETSPLKWKKRGNE